VTQPICDRRLFYELQRINMSGYLQGKDMAAPEEGKGAQAPSPAAAPAKPVSMAVTIPSLRAMRAASRSS
jgi:hypothetical protein